MQSARGGGERSKNLLGELRAEVGGRAGCQFKNNNSTELCCGSEAGSYLMLIDSCITQLKARGPSRTCNESKKKKKKKTPPAWRAPSGGRMPRWLQPAQPPRPSAAGSATPAHRLQGSIPAHGSHGLGCGLQAAASSAATAVCSWFRVPCRVIRFYGVSRF